MYANQGDNIPMAGCVERNFENEVAACRKRIAAASGLIASLDELDKVMASRHREYESRKAFTLMYGDMHLLLKQNRDRVDSIVKEQAALVKKQEMQLRKEVAKLAKADKKAGKPSPEKKEPAEEIGDKKGKSIV